MYYFLFHLGANWNRMHQFSFLHFLIRSYFLFRRRSCLEKNSISPLDIIYNYLSLHHKSAPLLLSSIQQWGIYWICPSNPVITHTQTGVYIYIYIYQLKYELEKAHYQLAGIYLKEQAEYIQNQIDKIRDSVEDRQSRIA